MALMLEITKADGSVARTPLESQATKVAAWPGGKVRVIDTATGKSPANLTAKRVGDSLIVENLPDGKSIEITKFYTDCTPAAQCALVIDPADAAQAATITQTTPPVATLGENQALMYGPTSSGGAAAVAPAAGGGMSTGAVLAGLGLLGVAAAAGGGGGGGSKTPADTTAPAAPSLPADFATNDDTPTIRVTLNGTGDTAPVAGDTVKLFLGATEVGTAVLTAGDIAAGHVDITTSSLGADGAKSLTATITDAAGNASSASAPLVVTLDTTVPDTTAPAAPSLPADFATNDDTPTIRVTLNGTGDTAPVAGDTVKLFLDATEVGTAVLTADDIDAGHVDITTSSLGDDGAKSLTATITDAAGNPSSASAPLVVTLDTAVPEAPTVAVAPNGIVSGTAEAGSTVTMGDQTATADAGTGAFQFATPLASGASATVVATDAAGNASPEADATAGTYEIGTAGDDVIIAGTTAFVDGGDGNDVLIGGAGGSVRNYQFEYWNTSGGGFEEGDDVFTTTANNGWTIGSASSSITVGPTEDDPPVGPLEQFTGGPMEILANDYPWADPTWGWSDDTGGGGRFYWETVFDGTSGGSSISQSIHTEPDETYTLSIQVSKDDGDSSLTVHWGGVEIARYDGLTDTWSGTNPPNPPEDVSESRQVWTWTVTGAPGMDTTDLEIRAYEATDGVVDEWGVGMRIDRITLDAVVPDGNETMAGGAGSDLLFGQAGGDTLYGGALGDTVATADGIADAFVYSMRTDNGHDVIMDFQVGTDRIFLVDALDKDDTASKLPGATDTETETTNADTNLSYEDFLGASQLIVIGDDGTGWLKLDFTGQTFRGEPTSVGSVVLEGVAASDYGNVESLFVGPNAVLSATMDGFHAGLLATV